MGFAALPFAGYRSPYPGARFGGGAGLVPLMYAGRFNMVNSEIDYSRHRTVNGSDGVARPVGRTHIAYLDGHVALKRNDELVHQDSGASTLDSLWSPLDFAQTQ
jgi:prepilin-type processing-associated H-X9-DG protein